MSNYKISRGQRIIIGKSLTADTRTCDVSLVDKDALLASSFQHVEDVKSAMAFLCNLLMMQANNHDYDKFDNIDQFYSDFKTKFQNHEWWDKHKEIQRHHLNKSCRDYSQINLLDVLEYVVDCCMAGLGRTGRVNTLVISTDLLLIAVENTVDLLVKNTEIIS